MKNSRLVYSTDSEFEQERSPNDLVAVLPNEQRIRLHLDRKVGGKIVTVIKGLQESKDTTILLARELKRACGVGGSIKGSDILIQGNQRTKIQSLLGEKGYDVVLSGG